jgi:2-iminobutanoate/2-iminopropanoate deaminase
MNHSCVSTDQAPKAVGPYSQAVWAGDFLFVSGQLPIDPRTGELVKGDIQVQSRQILENIKGLLSSQGLQLTNVCKSTVFLADIKDFARMNEVYAQYFSKDFPARSTVGGCALARGAAVEMECIAVRR